MTKKFWGKAPIRKAVALVTAAALLGVGAVLTVAGPASAHGFHPKPKYVTVAWNYQGYPDIEAPQPFIDFKPGKDINAFDSLAQQCGVHIQVDVYKTKDEHGKSWETLKSPQGLLYAHDGGFLAYNAGIGTPYKVIHGPANQTTNPDGTCFTGPNKPSKPPVPGEWKDSTITCDVNTVTQTRTVTNTTYSYNGTEWVPTETQTTETQTRPKTDAELKACATIPKPKVTHTEWVDETQTCDTDQVTQTRTETTTPFVWDTETHTYVEDTENAKTVTQTQTRDKTPAELKLCEAKVIEYLPAQFVDVCGVDKDLVQVPTDVEHVTYKETDERVKGVGPVTVTATADKGYAFLQGDGTTTSVLTQTFSFTDEKCATTPPGATPPTDKPSQPVVTPPKPTAPAGTTIVKVAPKPTATATPAATATGTLAYTGSEGTQIIGIAALVLLAAGGGLLLLRHRRKV